MKKFLISSIIVIIILFCVVWGISVLKCEILTYRYGEQFKTVYKENSMMGEIDYLKVLDYSNNYARVYYVSKNRAAGNILVFMKENAKWKYHKWENTVWSKTGSADGFIWPYIR